MANSTHRLEKELYDLVERDEQIFKFIEHSSLDGMWYWDLENPEHEWMSERFWTTLGYDPSQMKHLASEWQDIINQADLEVAFDNFTKHCDDPNHPYDQIVRYQHKLGQTVWIRCRGLAIRNNEGKPVRMLGAHTDLTELKTAEKKLLDTLKSRDLFFAKMSHEIRTPLHGIIGLTDLLKDSNKDESLDKTISTISACGEQLLVLLDDLLTIAKLNEDGVKLSKEPVQLSSVIDHIIDLFSAKASAKDLKLRTCLDADIVDTLIVTDKVRFIQILSNVVSNAIKFTSSGCVTINGRKLENSIEISIVDTGRGIDDVEAVIQPYLQENTDPLENTGTGLGLEIVSRLCAQLNHDFLIKSVLGEGTTVTLTCELAKDTAQHISHSNEVSAEIDFDLSLNNVLVVDDNEINIEIACQMLAGVAKQVDRAFNGEDAIKQVRRNGPYDIILMDLNMPLMDGFKASEEILRIESLNKMPVIIAVSADAFEDTLKACKASGMHGHLKKPFTRDTLLRYIATF
ncbi:response regulator [Glaciecola sp. MH2013]|uniref:PAS domain-containing hybrid sensor histidine kinase/response regulator n=1 Tax=Glaciecola sp. MH2013 TaxID=2785524 RepID=UPI00189E0699|nr:PAS domain-containing hybrid sensor histidine kinase/response regulator [Glaciecola sp. MH2013]MBF7073592.1 response regulator [Glaciecola sp. MH2013]